MFPQSAYKINPAYHKWYKTGKDIAQPKCQIGDLGTVKIEGKVIAKIQKK
jgi:hypothetical protein